MLVKVINLYRAESFEVLLKKVDIKKTGFDDIKELNKAILEFYTPEKQRKFGVLGIEIEPMQIKLTNEMQP